MSMPDVVTSAANLFDFGAPTLGPRKELTCLLFRVGVLAEGSPYFNNLGFCEGPLKARQVQYPSNMDKIRAAWSVEWWLEIIRALCCSSPSSVPASLTASSIGVENDQQKNRKHAELRVPRKLKISSDLYSRMGKMHVRGWSGLYWAWANPARIGRDDDRQQVIEAIEKYVVLGLDVDASVELRGLDLFCHCGIGEDCQDVILRPWANGDPKLPTVQEEEAPEPDLLGDGLSLRLNTKDSARQIPEEEHGSWETPRMTTCFDNRKPFSDGGGLCSPGRWSKAKRQLSGGNFAVLSPLLWSAFSAEVARLGLASPKDFVVRLSAEKYNECPFSNSSLRVVRDVAAEALGVCLGWQSVPEQQAVYLGLVKALLMEAGDSDALFMDLLAERVPIGVDGSMSRTPLVCEQKEKRSLDPDDADSTGEVLSCKAITGHMEEVKAQFMEQGSWGWMEQMEDSVARERFGERLALAALGL